MNHYQLVRLAAHKLLSQHSLWLPAKTAAPTFEDEACQNQELTLTEYGLPLLQTLCDKLNIPICKAV